jgi:hypothetical protein
MPRDESFQGPAKRDLPRFQIAQRTEDEVQLVGRKALRPHHLERRLKQITMYLPPMFLESNSYLSFVMVR